MSLLFPERSGHMAGHGRVDVKKRRDNLHQDLDLLCRASGYTCQVNEHVHLQMLSASQAWLKLAVGQGPEAGSAERCMQAQCKPDSAMLEAWMH